MKITIIEENYKIDDDGNIIDIYKDEYIEEYDEYDENPIIFAVQTLEKYACEYYSCSEYSPYGWWSSDLPMNYNGVFTDYSASLEGFTEKEKISIYDKIEKRKNIYI